MQPTQKRSNVIPVIALVVVFLIALASYFYRVDRLLARNPWNGVLGVAGLGILAVIIYYLRK